jgi:stage III sporulation protein AE
MRYDSSNNKKFAFNLVVILVLIGLLFDFKINIFSSAFAENDSSNDLVSEEELNEHISDILDDIDSNELDDYLLNDFNFDFLDVSSFKSLAIKILNGTYFDEYNSLFDGIVSTIKENLKELFSVFLTIVAVVLLFEMFSNLSSEKYKDLKKTIKIIFSLVIVLILMILLKDIASLISSSIEKIFNFSRILFPILLNLILLSGASSSYSVYSSLSLFLLDTGSYIFVYILLPISVSIMFLSLFGSVFQNKRFLRVIDITKSIFKYIIVAYFGIFGLFSAVNMVSSGLKDGVSLKLTKFAIKNYIPVLGGYISDGFDFVHSCSVLIKNAFGVCGIIVLFFLLLKPLIIYFVYLMFFKLLALVVAFVGNEFYSDMFNNVSKCMSYFITILVGVFMIFFIYVYLLIVSVSVV